MFSGMMGSVRCENHSAGKDDDHDDGENFLHAKLYTGQPQSQVENFSLAFRVRSEYTGIAFDGKRLPAELAVPFWHEKNLPLRDRNRNFFRHVVVTEKFAGAPCGHTCPL